MKKLQTFVNRALFMSVLAVGLSVVADAALAGSAGLTTVYTAPSHGMLLASTDFKGEHRYTSHVAYERHLKNKQPAQLEEKSGVVPVAFRGKPPYNRHVAKQQPLEKVQFARFEPTTDVMKGAHSPIYRGTPGQRPPYRR